MRLVGERAKSIQWKKFIRANRTKHQSVRKNALIVRFKIMNDNNRNEQAKPDYQIARTALLKAQTLYRPWESKYKDIDQVIERLENWIMQK